MTDSNFKMEIKFAFCGPSDFPISKFTEVFFEIITVRAHGIFKTQDRKRDNTSHLVYFGLVLLDRIELDGLGYRVI